MAGIYKRRSAARCAARAARAGRRRDRRVSRSSSRRSSTQSRRCRSSISRTCRRPRIRSRSQNAWAEDVPRAVAERRRGIRERARPRRRPTSRCRPHESTPSRSPPRTRSGLLDAGEVVGDELFAAYLAAIGERDPELHAYLHVCDDAGRRGIPIAIKDVISDQGRPDDGRLEDPRELRARLRRDRDGALQGARAAAARQDEHRRVRDGLVDRELRLRPDAQPVGPDAGARRLGRRQRRRGHGRPCALGARLGHGRLDQAAVGALRQRRAAPRPTGRSRATASSRSPRRSTRSARSRRTCATARSCTR